MIESQERRRTSPGFPERSCVERIFALCSCRSALVNWMRLEWIKANESLSAETRLPKLALAWNNAQIFSCDQTQERRDVDIVSFCAACKRRGYVEIAK